MGGNTLYYSRRFKRQFKKLQHSGRGTTMRRLQAVIAMMLRGEVLPAQFRNHRLTGKLADFWECHVEPDWLLLYRCDAKNKSIELAAMGSHSELFD